MPGFGYWGPLRGAFEGKRLERFLPEWAKMANTHNVPVLATLFAKLASDTVEDMVGVDPRLCCFGAQYRPFLVWVVATEKRS